MNNDPFYEPFKPSTFVCQPAAALIITKGGEIEVVSQECSVAIATFPKFQGIGRTSSLLNEELVILGDDDLGTRGRYISIQKPREGLLALKYTVHDLPLRQTPHKHSSLVSRNTLTVVGGKFKSRGKLSKFAWTELSLKWENGSKYIPSLTANDDVHINTEFHGACLGDIGNVFRSIFPFQGEFCPGELGQLPPALELASEHGECVPTHQA